VSREPAIVNRAIRRTVIVLTVLAGLAWAWHELNVWPLRRALPWSATDIHEWSREDGFLPDYTYLLKAKITPEEFRSYVHARGLTPHAASREYEDQESWLGWQGRSGLPWWTPTDSLDTTFVANYGREWTYAKYEDGYIYVKSLCH
jgi:hypothetical protein